VNLGRKKARTIEKNISSGGLGEHFIELIEGVKGMGEETGEKRRMEREQEKEQRKEEIEILLKKIKKKKSDRD